MSKKQKKILTRIIASSVLLLSAVFVKDGMLSFALFFLSYLLIGYDVLIKAAKNILSMSLLDENFLMAIATVCAFLIKEYSEASAIMLFYQIGELFQSIALGKSRKSIKELMDICPETAAVLRDGKETEVSPDEVSVGEIILIRPGEKVPLDSVIIEGSASVDTAALTGESMPQDVSVGDKIVSGTVNLSGVIKATVKSEFSDSTVSKILELVESSTEKKSKSENFITRFAHFYTPIVVVLALLLAVIPPLLLGESFSSSVYTAIVFLVVSCPCALVISVPLSFFGGIGAASKKGILIKGSVYLEKLSSVKNIIFDKTGTLTEGKFSVTDVNVQNLSRDEMLKLTSLAEGMSLHPIALSIISYTKTEPDESKVKDLEEISGMGISAVVEGRRVLAGNEKLMQRENIQFISPKIPGTTVHVAIDGIYAGYITVSDKVKPTSKEAMEMLKASGIRNTVMLTGDNKKTAEAIGNELSISKVYSELLPQDKVSVTEEIIEKQDKNSVTAFCGDGINDAPVLARADIGISMGAMGSDAAIEASDIVLMDDDLRKIARAIKISKKTMKIVRENIAFSLIVKIGVLILGALKIANIWLAVFSDVGVMVIAVLNSMRCLKD